jgi:hypothetical protein
MNYKLSEKKIIKMTKTVDAEYKSTNLDDVPKTCKKLHLEEQYQLKMLLPKYEYLFDGTLGEFRIQHGTH